MRNKTQTQVEFGWVSGVQWPIWGENGVGNNEGNLNRHRAECRKS
jgi:hypothetical protein